MSDEIEVDAAIWSGIIHYIKTLHKAGAVDDTAMKFHAYYPLEHCMGLWGIEPYKVQNNPPFDYRRVTEDEESPIK